MQTETDHLALLSRLSSVEAELQRLKNSRKAWRRGVFTAASLGVCVSLVAQTAPAALTLQSLAQQVTAIAGDVGGLMQIGIQQRFVNDELRLNQLQQALAAVKNQNKSSSSVQAPFQVVNADGDVLFQVGEANGAGSIKILSPKSAQDSATLFFTVDGPALYMVDHGGHTVLGRKHFTGALGLYLGAGENDDVSLDTEGNVGNLHLFSGKKQVGSFSANSNGAKIQANDLAGNASFSAGIGLSGDDAFVRVNSKSGAAAMMGAPQGPAMGVRLYGKDGKTATAGMVEDDQGNAKIGVASQGKWRATMQILADQGHIGVLGNGSEAYLAALTSYPGAGGALQIAIPSAQVVSLIDANPATSQGRAIFTNAGGEPLAKIGGAGAHGDILLGGPNKALAVWEMMLTGFH